MRTFVGLDSPKATKGAKLTSARSSLHAACTLDEWSWRPWCSQAEVSGLPEGRGSQMCLWKLFLSQSTVLSSSTSTFCTVVVLSHSYLGKLVGCASECSLHFVYRHVCFNAVVDNGVDTVSAQLHRRDFDRKRLLVTANIGYFWGRNRSIWPIPIDSFHFSSHLSLMIP